MRAVLARVPAPLRPYVVPAIALLVALFALPLMNNYWIKTFTQTAIIAIVCLGANILYGRVGLATLCQIGFMTVGTWVACRWLFWTGWPLPLCWLVAGLVTALVGVIIGLPALRLGGLPLAMLTLMAAGGIAVIIAGLKFPNGGPGFKGLVVTVETRKTVGRPMGFQGDTAWYRLCVLLAALCIFIAHTQIRGRAGRAWAAIRQSEPAAIAAGIDVTRYKMLAFALASFMAGVAGGLFAGTVRKGMSLDAFNRQAAIFLIAVTIMGGIYSLWGGVLGAFFATCLLKFLTQNVVGHAFWTRFSLSLFGFGLLMNLIQGTKAAEKKGVAA